MWTTTGTRPVFCRSDSAVLRGIPCTYGTETVPVPTEYTMLIGVPLLAFAPGAGEVEMTSRLGTVAERFPVRDPTVNPAALSWDSAEVRDEPTTFGTATPLLLPLMSFTAMRIAASTATAMMTATQGHTLRGGRSPVPLSSGP